MNISSAPAANNALAQSPTPTQSSVTTGSSAGASSSDPGGISSLATQGTFITLLVAQLENQDPTDPADSTQFVTQLAQFQTMEQSLSQGQDISAIRQDADQIVTLITGNSSSSGSSGSTAAAPGS